MNGTRNVGVPETCTSRTKESTEGRMGEDRATERVSSVSLSLTPYLLPYLSLWIGRSTWSVRDFTKLPKKPLGFTRLRWMSHKYKRFQVNSGGHEKSSTLLTVMRLDERFHLIISKGLCFSSHNGTRNTTDRNLRLMYLRKRPVSVCRDHVYPIRCRWHLWRREIQTKK